SLCHRQTFVSVLGGHRPRPGRARDVRVQCGACGSARTQTPERPVTPQDGRQADYPVLERNRLNFIDVVHEREHDETGLMETTWTFRRLRHVASRHSAARFRLPRQQDTPRSNPHISSLRSWNNREARLYRCWKRSVLILPMFAVSLRPVSRVCPRPADQACKTPAWLAPPTKSCNAHGIWPISSAMNSFLASIWSSVLPRCSRPHRRFLRPQGLRRRPWKPHSNRCAETRAPPAPMPKTRISLLRNTA